MQALCFLLTSVLGTLISCSQASEFTVSRTRSVAGAVSEYRVNIPTTFMNCSSGGTKCIFKVGFHSKNIYDHSDVIAATNVSFDANGATQCTLSKASAGEDIIPDYTEVPSTTHADYEKSILTVAQDDGTIVVGTRVMIVCGNIANP